ncbi:DHH family phosphoesterase [Candidatus Saccharibacteria bacterium]|nr:DHH family phosphoesterase [Candidatus Saccharibacteria bacterium]
MTDYKEADDIKRAIEVASKIVIVQADNPDADSLASSLALEEILSNQAKVVTLFCGVDIPAYLSYIPGSDRVINDLPKQFDLSIIVDTSSDTLLEQLNKDGAKNWLAAKPCVIIDHHSTSPTIGFASIVCTHPAVATAEVIYELSRQLNWKLNPRARELIAVGILSDSLGLTSEATTARSIHIIAELVEEGVRLAQLEDIRRETMRRDPQLIHYKGELLRRVEFHADDRVASITIPQNEINEYSPLYNPPMLVLDDMRLAKNVQIAIAFKTYEDGRVTAKLRCNFGSAIADKLAEHFGGGGHPYAAGFKIPKADDFNSLKADCIKKAVELLEEQASN